MSTVHSNSIVQYHIGHYLQALTLELGLGKVPLTNRGFRKLMEVSVNEWQKLLISKTLTERISRF